MRWLDPYWPKLCAGERLEVRFEAHPQQLGFRRLAFAEGHGQLEDWALSLPDGSRLHLWYMPGGGWVLHRDAIDPARGPLHAAAHVATATRLGRAVLLGAAIVGIASAVVLLMVS